LMKGCARNAFIAEGEGFVAVVWALKQQNS
jgi:hypothetical protein